MECNKTSGWKCCCFRSFSFYYHSFIVSTWGNSPKLKKKKLFYIRKEYGKHSQVMFGVKIHKAFLLQHSDSLCSANTGLLYCDEQPYNSPRSTREYLMFETQHFSVWTHIFYVLCHTDHAAGRLSCSRHAVVKNAA